MSEQPTSIHDEIKQALADLQKEIGDLEKVAGHELLRLRDGVVGALQAIRSARVGHQVVEQPIEAGAGAVVDSPHPETAAAEPVVEEGQGLPGQPQRPVKKAKNG